MKESIFVLRVTLVLTFIILSIGVALAGGEPEEVDPESWLTAPITQDPFPQMIEEITLPDDIAIHNPTEWETGIVQSGYFGDSGYYDIIFYENDDDEKLTDNNIKNVNGHIGNSGTHGLVGSGVFGYDQSLSYTFLIFCDKTFNVIIHDYDGHHHHPAPSPVPVPAVTWLFGVIIVALVSTRKKNFG